VAPSHRRTDGMPANPEDPVHGWEGAHTHTWQPTPQYSAVNPQKSNWLQHSPAKHARPSAEAPQRYGAGLGSNGAGDDDGLGTVTALHVPYAACARGHDRARGTTSRAATQGAAREGTKNMCGVGGGKVTRTAMEHGCCADLWLKQRNTPPSTQVHT
jgi:hypothetical protein